MKGRRSIRLLAAPTLLALALAAAPAALAAGAPQITDTWATQVSATGVVLHGDVNPNEVATSVKAEYVTSSSYEESGFDAAISSPVAGLAIGAGSVPVEFKRAIGGLKPGTGFRYRIVAASTEGIVPGPIRSFATASGEPEAPLPDGRSWEMVSPVDKNGGGIQRAGGVFGGGLPQVAADGEAVTYSSLFSFAGGQANPGASQYVSRRTPSAWTTENVAVPTAGGAIGTEPDGVPYQLFSGDLGNAVVADLQRCAGAPCLRRYVLRQTSSGDLAVSSQTTDLQLAGASPSLAAVVLSTCAALTPAAIEVPASGSGCDPAEANLYLWSGGAPQLLNLLPGESQGTPGAELAAPIGAVSEDGARVYFDLGGDIYLRAGGGTVQIDKDLGGGGSFQAATPDGALAFFSKGGHLFRYTASSGAIADLTPDGGVTGMLGASPDGAYVYYLTGAGLFATHAGLAIEVAAGADSGNYPPAEATARVAANGNLAFVSSLSLTGADTGGLSQVYLYEAASNSLVCASCNLSGARPIGPSTIAGAVVNGGLPGATRLYRPRVLSAAGNRVFFDSGDAIVGSDTNDDDDVYEWEADGVGSCAQAQGCVALISSGRAEEGATFLDASVDGADVFFVTDGSLVDADPGAGDVYDARVGGGFPNPPESGSCLGDSCQVVPGEPESPALGTGFYRAEANASGKSNAGKKHRKHKHKRHKHRKHKRGWR